MSTASSSRTRPREGADEQRSTKAATQAQQERDLDNLLGPQSPTKDSHTDAPYNYMGDVDEPRGRNRSPKSLNAEPNVVQRALTPLRRMKNPTEQMSRGMKLNVADLSKAAGHPLQCLVTGEDAFQQGRPDRPNRHIQHMHFSNRALANTTKEENNAIVRSYLLSFSLSQRQIDGQRGATYGISTRLEEQSLRG